jgi:hypothetical protein
MPVDGDAPLPLLDKPVARTQCEAQLFHVAIEWIEVLMVQHPRWHMDGIALIPLAAFAADLGIAVTFQCAEMGFGMGMAAKKSPARHAIGALARALDIFVG